MPSEKKNDNIEQLLAVAADMQQFNHSDRLARLIRDISGFAENTETLSDEVLGHVAGGVKWQEKDGGNKR